MAVADSKTDSKADRIKMPEEDLVVAVAVRAVAV